MHQIINISNSHSFIDYSMYALQMQTACQGEGTGEPDDPSSLHQEPARPAMQDCSSFDIVRATQVILAIKLKTSSLNRLKSLFKEKRVYG